MSFFYGVYPKDRGLRAFLSLVRYVCQPDAIRYAHITVRGPYVKPLPRSQIFFLNCSINPLQQMHLHEPDSFFNGQQNTVLLTVDSDSLKEVWHKPDYPEAIAHITLYDGNSRFQAIKILSLLRSYSWSMRFSTSALKVIEPKISENDGFLPMASEIHRAYEKFQDEIDLPELEEMPLLDFSTRLSVLNSMMEISGLKKSADNHVQRVSA